MRSIQKAVIFNTMCISNYVNDLLFTGFNGWSYQREHLAGRINESVRSSVRNNIKP